MNCQTCGKPLPTGVAFCPSCGAATPYNTINRNAASPYAPTIASPYGTPPPSQPSAQNPYTGYGAGMSPQDPYSNTPPSYAGSMPAQNPYAAPPVTPAPYSYGMPGTQGYPSGIQAGTYNTNMQPKRRSRVGLIIGIALVGLVLLCGGLIAIVAVAGKNASTTATVSTDAATPTSPATPPSSVPTSSNIVPTASKIIFNVQTSSAIDADDNPTNVTTSFTAGQTVYLTFQDDSQGKDGFIQVKWYKDGTLVSTQLLKHSAQNNIGYFSRPYGDTGNAAAALYWCTQSSCGDAQLAQVNTFTIKASAAVPSNNSGIVAVLKDKRRID